MTTNSNIVSVTVQASTYAQIYPNGVITASSTSINYGDYVTLTVSSPNTPYIIAYGLFMNGSEMFVTDTTADTTSWSINPPAGTDTFYGVVYFADNSSFQTNTITVNVAAQPQPTYIDIYGTIKSVTSTSVKPYFTFTSNPNTYFYVTLYNSQGYSFTGIEIYNGNGTYEVPEVFSTSELSALEKITWWAETTLSDGSILKSNIVTVYVPG